MDVAMPGPVKTSGIVLARWDFGNTSRILALLTADRGQVSVLHKGARRAKGGAGLGGGLDLLSENEILYYERRGGGLAVLAEWSELADPATGLAAHPVRFAAAEVLLEYARACSSEGEASPEAYRLLADGTRLLTGAERLIPAALALALAMLSAAGFRPAVDACAACGQKPPGGAWKGPATLCAEQGGLLCTPCAAAAERRRAQDRRGRSRLFRGTVRLSGEACALLGALVRLAPEAAARLRPSRRAEHELLRAVESYGSWRLEHRMRALTALGLIINRLEAVGCR